MILINGRFLTQRLTGVHRFAYELCCALVRQGVEIKVIAPRDIRPEYHCPFPVVTTCGKGSHGWEQWILPLYIRRHFPGQWLLSLTGLCPILYNRNILTIHDVAYLKNPHWYSRAYYWFYRIMTPLAAARSAEILTVSLFSRDELVKYMHLDSKHIHIVYNAVNTEPLGHIQPSERPYILSVCTLDPRKNLSRLLEAYSRIENRDFDLYLVGGSNSVFQTPELSQYRHMKGVRFLGYIGDDEQLGTLYRNALAFVSPSLYEGFGIPNLEAMYRSCPLVVSDIPVYHEICGPAALYMNPMDIDDMCRSISRIAGDAELRQQLIVAGSEQVKRFDWDTSARKVLSILNSYE